MKVGVFTVILGDLKFERALDYLAGLDVQAVELGAGGYARSSHCPLDALLGALRSRRLRPPRPAHTIARPSAPAVIPL
jgi:sugar phosphate isomerase/epimerase